MGLETDRCSAENNGRLTSLSCPRVHDCQSLSLAQSVYIKRTVVRGFHHPRKFKLSSLLNADRNETDVHHHPIHVLPEYLISFRNDASHTFSLASVEVEPAELPSDLPSTRPEKELGPGKTATLSWNVIVEIGNTSTIGRVTYEKPVVEPGMPGEGRIFGVGIQYQAIWAIPPPETFKNPYFETYLQHVGAAPEEWARPNDQDKPDFTEYSFNVPTPSPYIVTITELIGGARKKAIGVTIKHTFELKK